MHIDARETDEHLPSVNACSLCCKEYSGADDLIVQTRADTKTLVHMAMVWLDLARHGTAWHHTFVANLCVGQTENVSHSMPRRVALFCCANMIINRAKAHAMLRLSDTVDSHESNARAKVVLSNAADAAVASGTLDAWGARPLVSLGRLPQCLRRVCRVQRVVELKHNTPLLVPVVRSVSACVRAYEHATSLNFLQTKRIRTRLHGTHTNNPQLVVHIVCSMRACEYDMRLRFEKACSLLLSPKTQSENLQPCEA